MSRADNTYKGRNKSAWYCLIHPGLLENHYISIYIIVLEEAKHFQLAKDTFGRDERLEDVRHLLQSDTLAIARICHRPVKSNGK